MAANLLKIKSCQPGIRSCTRFQAKVSKGCILQTGVELVGTGRKGKPGGAGSQVMAWLSGWRSWLRRVLLALLVVALIPVFLTLVYAIPNVHPLSTLMVRDMVLLREVDRRWVPLEEVAPVLVASVTMSEDGQFCSHRGIDLGALNEVLADFMEGGSPRGASTIPMQTAKNLFLWHGRSYVRKVLELPLAIYLDAVLSKRRILEIYLNIAEWGPGIYGIEAAAQHHFGRSAARLSARQAALLAVTLPNPHQRNPASPGATLNRLANIIQKRAAGAGGHLECLRGGSSSS